LAISSGLEFVVLRIVPWILWQVNCLYNERRKHYVATNVCLQQWVENLQRLQHWAKNLQQWAEVSCEICNNGKRILGNRLNPETSRGQSGLQQWAENLQQWAVYLQQWVENLQRLQQWAKNLQQWAEVFCEIRNNEKRIIGNRLNPETSQSQSGLQQWAENYNWQRISNNGPKYSARFATIGRKFATQFATFATMGREFATMGRSIQ